MAVSRVVQGMVQDSCGKAEQWRWAMRIFEAERLESWMEMANSLAYDRRQFCDKGIACFP